MAPDQKHDLIFSARTGRRSGRVYLFSDEGGVQGAGVLRAAGSRLKKLLYQGRLLLLQLGDALALLRHLLEQSRKEPVSRFRSSDKLAGFAGRRLNLCEKSVLVLQPLDGLWRRLRVG